MDGLLSIKNRYWLFIILPILLFVTRYYLYFVLRAPALENEGIENVVTFQSFLIYNYLLGAGLMFLFLFTFFLLSKGIVYLWHDLDNKKLLKIILISYCVFFIPDIASSIYFTIFHPEFRVGELKEFRRNFYLESEMNPYELGDDVLKIILSSVGFMDFAFFLSIVVLFHLLFEEISTKQISSIAFILAIIYFSFKVALPLLMI
jgi:hypothetical protein